MSWPAFTESPEVERGSPSRSKIVGKDVGGDAAIRSTSCRHRMNRAVCACSAGEENWRVTRLKKFCETSKVS